MQIIAPVKLAINLPRRTLTLNRLRKIHHVIKRLTFQNPLIHSLPRNLPVPITILLLTGAGRAKRRDGPADRKVTRLLCVGDDLRKRFDQVVADGLLGAGVGCAAADVVDADEDHDPFCADLVDGVALVAGEERGAQAS